MYKKVLLFIFILSTTVSIYGQKTNEQKALEKKRAQLQQEISKVNKLLFSTQKQGEDLLQTLADLNKKIQVRSDYIKAIQAELVYIQNQVLEKETLLEKLNKEFTELKEDYAGMIFKSYQSKSEQNKLMFLLSSDDFFQAYKRYRYMKQYASFRKKQGEVVLMKSKEIEALKRSLQSQENSKQNLLKKSKLEFVKIEQEQEEQALLIKRVKSKEKSYIVAINKKQKEERKLEKEIERVIREAIAALNKKKVVKKTINTNTKSNGFALTPEGKILANRFEKNRGTLPWPVSEGVVTRKYGVIPHPTLRGIKIDSKGIHITTKRDASARAVFKGEVLAIQSVNGRNAVYVRHGNYISLYNNLDKVYVTKGQQVVLKQTLGTVFEDKITGKTILKFQIWKDTQRQNPTYWLSRM